MSTYRHHMNAKFPILAFSVLFLSYLLVPTQVFAWGKEGHEIVAHIAYGRISPATRIKVNRLLSDTPGAVGPELLVEASFWPDAIKWQPGTPVAIFKVFGVRNAAGTSAFHYADMQGSRYNPDTDSDGGKSVVSGIERCKAVIRGTNASPTEKREALKFLVHLVGDIHQPLHAGRRSDKGGNTIKIPAFLNRKPAAGFNLHQVWDSLLIESKSRDSKEYADSISKGLSKLTATSYRGERNTARWLEESHKLAFSNAYVDARRKPIQSGTVLGQDYVTRNRPVVERQLTKAGVRLAALLDELMK